MSSEIKGRCWHCGAGLRDVDYAREGTCHSCSKPTHVCRNCRWYAPSKPNLCAEPVAELIIEKQRANFCGYFEATLAAAAPGVAPTSDEALRKAAEALFNLDSTVDRKDLT